MSPRTTIAAARVFLVLAVAAILWLATTDVSYPVVDSVPDKFNHGIAFAVLALLADQSFPASRLGLAKVLALVAFGIGIEVLQYFLPHREASFFDVLADVAGIAAYALCLPLLDKIPVLRRPAKD